MAQSNEKVKGFYGKNGWIGLHSFEKYVRKSRGTKSFRRPLSIVPYQHPLEAVLMKVHYRLHGLTHI